MWETSVQSLGWEDLLEKGKATHNPVISNNFSFFLIIIPTHTHLDLFVITVFIGLMGVLTLDLSFICRIEQS